MPRRSSDPPETDFSYLRYAPTPAPASSQQNNGQRSPFWTLLNFVAAGAAAGLIGWGTLNTRMTNFEERAKEDRQMFREAIEGVKNEIRGVRFDLQSVREDQLRERAADAPPQRPHAAFPRGKQFDK